MVDGRRWVCVLARAEKEDVISSPTPYFWNALQPSHILVSVSLSVTSPVTTRSNLWRATRAGFSFEPLYAHHNLVHQFFQRTTPSCGGPAFQRPRRKATSSPRSLRRLGLVSGSVRCRDCGGYGRSATSAAGAASGVVPRFQMQSKLPGCAISSRWVSNAGVGFLEATGRRGCRDAWSALASWTLSETITRGWSW